MGVRTRKPPRPEVLGSGGGRNPPRADGCLARGLWPRGFLCLWALAGPCAPSKPRDLLTPRLAFVLTTSNLSYVVSSANVTRNSQIARAFRPDFACGFAQALRRACSCLVPSLAGASCRKVLKGG